MYKPQSWWWQSVHLGWEEAESSTLLDHHSQPAQHHSHHYPPFLTFSDDNFLHYNDANLQQGQTQTQNILTSKAFISCRDCLFSWQRPVPSLYPSLLHILLIDLLLFTYWRNNEPLLHLYKFPSEMWTHYIHLVSENCHSPIYCKPWRWPSVHCLWLNRHALFDEVIQGRFFYSQHSLPSQLPLA